MSRKNMPFSSFIALCLMLSALSPLAHGASEPVTRGYRALDAGDVDQAKRIFIDAVQLQGGDTLALEGLATTLYLSDDFERAKRTLNILVRRDEGSAYARALLGTVMAREQNYPEAIAHLRRATEMEPRRASFHNNLGIVLLESGDDAGAETAFRSAVRANSRHPESNYNLAVVLATGKRKNLREARRHYDEAVRNGFPADSRLETLFR